MTMTARLPRLATVLGLCLGLSACATPSSAAPPASLDLAAVEAAPASVRCPSELPRGARCYRGRTEAGAYYWIAYPEDWNGVLVVHAHGGPRVPAPEQDDPVEDLERFSVMLREGYAWAGSTYRRGGYGVRMAAEDTDQLRQLVWDTFGRPQYTLLHGQSWGGNVAAKASELYATAADGSRLYDGVLLTSGVLAGGTRAYGFRADLRAVYQFYCNNHPRPDEPAYPVWQGLPLDQSMRRAELEARVQACTGVGLPVSRRTAAQRARLRNILAVVPVEEDQLVAHLWWGTNLFQDMVGRRLEGRNPFSNINTVYSGSDDDAALNAGIQRFEADPAAVAMLAEDSDLTGRISVPTLTVHAIHDPTAFVAHEALYRRTVAEAGHGDLLVQTFTDEAEHSRLSTPQYPALLEALMVWIRTGERPTPQAVADRCRPFARRYGQPCRFVPDFTP